MRTERPLMVLVLSLGLTLAGLALVLALVLPQIVRADPGVIYVDASASGANDGTSWANAYTRLQDGLDAASSGDEVWVAEGVYTPTTGVTRTATFQLVNSVALYGGFAATETLRSERDWTAHITILSGDLDGNDIADPNGVVTDAAHIVGDNAYHVVTGSGVTGTAVLDGFTVTGGKADGLASPHDRGGGIYSQNGSPTLGNLTFSGNSASLSGGGMFNDFSNPQLTGVAFSGNAADLDGGGMGNLYSSPTLVNVTFSGNSAGDGGGIYNIVTSNPTLINVTFSGNSADYGGGMYNSFYSDPVLTNVTFSGNTATWDGGGMLNAYYSDPTLTNCILWGNTGPQIYNSFSGPSVAYSLVQGGYAGGTHIIDADPLFADPDGLDNVSGTLDDDLRLLPASPAIDAGNNLSVTVSTDLDGNPRFVDIVGAPDAGNGTPPIVDMGAYEASFVDLAIVKALFPTTAGPGQLITYTLAFTNEGSLPATGVVITDTIPASVTNTSVISTGVGITQTSPGYAWSVQDLAPGQSGVLTISGRIDSGLSGPFSFTNTAVITTTAADADTTNNRSHVQTRVLQVVYVDAGASGANDGTSWANAYTNLQDGLDAASSGVELWVAGGVYVPTAGITRTATFQLVGGVALYGGFAATETSRDQRDWTTHITVLSGDLDGNDVTDPSGVVTDPANIVGSNAYQVVAGGGVTETAILDGFTVTGGQADREAWFCWYCKGGGMYNYQGSPTLVNVTFSGNTGTWGGGMGNDYSHPLLINVTFSNNSATKSGGGIYNAYSDPTLIGVTFTGNNARWGGGMLNNFSDPLLTNVAFSGNVASENGGGIYNLSGSDPTLVSVTFSGNSAAGNGGGMYNEEYSNPTLTDVTFSGNVATSGGGMHNSYSDPALTNVTFRGNNAVNGGGIYNVGYDSPYYGPLGSNPTLTNVTFSGNSAEQGGGMYNLYNSSPSLANVTFSGNAATNVGGGMSNYDNSHPTLTNSILWGNTATSAGQIYNDASVPGVTYSLVQGGYPGTGNIDADPLFVRSPDPGDGDWATLGDNDYGDLHLLPASLAIDAGDNAAIPPEITTDLDGNPRIVNGTADMGAYEAQYSTLYVDADAPGAGTGLSWTDAFSEVQSALSAAHPGQEIWVAEGIYAPTDATGRDATFQLVEGVALYGGFGGYGISETLRTQRDWLAHVTVLSGDLDGNDVTDPNGIVTGPAHIVGDNAYHVVTAGGVTGTAILDGFTITGGKANGTSPHDRGGGMYNDGGSPALANVTFSGNTASYGGGGVYNVGFANPALANVTFSGNSATVSGGGMYNDSSNPLLTNVAFSGNAAGLDGGGIYNFNDSNPSLVNVTFSANTATSFGGGIYNYGFSDPALTNCILWGNSAPSGAQIHDSGSTPSVAYSLVQGGYAGGTNIVDADPLFVDADGSDNVSGTLDDNLRLLPTSPAIDAGDNTAVPAGVTTDLDGNLRFVDVASAPDTGAGTPPIVDMGAYEAASPDLVMVKNAVPALATAGQAVTYTLTFSNVGWLPATGIVITDTIPVSVTNTSVISSGGVTITQTSPGYVWSVQDLAPGQGGVIIITGLLSDSLPAGTFTNTATIACVEEESDDGNNSDSASIALAPEITVAPPSLSFGNQDVDDGPTASQTVVITNDGSADLHFTGAITLTGTDAGEFTIVGNTGENPLPPGSRRRIRVSFDPSSVGVKSANLSVQSDDGDESTVDVALSATGVDQEITVAPPGLSFGSQDVAAGATVSQTVVITNDGSADLYFTSAITLTGADPGEFNIESDTGEDPLTPGSVRRIGVSFDPSSTGLKSASLAIRSDDSDESEVNVALSGTGGTASEITVAPPSLSFGSQDVDAGPTVSQTVVISNDGRVNLNFTGAITLAGTDPGEFSIESDTGENPLTPGSVRTIGVSFDPSSTGLRSANLTIRSDDGDESEVNVALRGFGIDGEITVTPPSLAFGNQDVGAGATASQVVVIANDGWADLNFTSAIALTGADPGEFTIESDTGENPLPPGGRRRIEVSFDPSSVGNKSANLTIRSDDGDEPSVNVALGGRGVAIPEIAVAPRSLSFGSRDVDAGATATRAVVITNEGSADLSFTSAITLTGTDTGEFTIKSDTGQNPLAPGNSRTVRVSFDPSSTGTKSAELTIQSNDGDEPLVDVSLRGQGVDQEITVAPPSLSFGEQDVDGGATAAQMVIIINGGSANLQFTSPITLAGNDAGEFAIVGDTGENPLPPGSTRTVRVSFDPSGVGVKSASLSVQSDDSDEPAVNVALGGKGVLVPEITVAPSGLAFGSQDVDDGPTATQMVVITNEGAGDLNFTSPVSVTGANAGEFTIQSDTGQNPLPPGNSRTVRVSFDPSSVGSKSAELTIQSDDGDEPTVDVALRGTGVDQEITLFPPSLAFGSQDLDAGATVAQMVIIVNDGTADLSFTRAITLTGTDAGEFTIESDTGQNPLPPGSSRTVRVSFDPSSVGNKSASLTIQSDDRDEPTVNVALSGTGVDQDITVVPSSLAFGSQDLDAGPTVSQTVVVTNDGTADLSFTSAITLTGTDAGEFTIESDTGENPLPPGNSRTIQVSFDPSSVGSKSASLTIQSDDGDEPAVDVALSGAGTAENNAPVADAGDDQTVAIHTIVTLDGSVSFDPDGNVPLTYGWTQTGGPTVTFGRTLSVTTFTAPNEPTTLTFTLSVTDSLGLVSAPDEVVITVIGFRLYLPLVVRESP